MTLGDAIQDLLKDDTISVRDHNRIKALQDKPHDHVAMEEAEWFVQFYRSHKQPKVLYRGPQPSGGL